MRKNNHLIDTTPQYYLIKVSSGSEKALVSSLIPNKVELTREDIDTMTHDNYYGKSIEKFRKILDNE